MSGVPWALMFAIPWMNLETGVDLEASESLNPTGYAVVLAGILYGLSQVMWIVGLWCVGRDGLSQVKSHVLNHTLVQSVLQRLGFITKKGHQSSSS